jgi:hypothetical protein
MSFTLVNSNSTFGAAGATTVATTVTGVGAGNLVVIYTGNNQPATMTVDDGGSDTPTQDTINTGSGSVRTQFHYILSSVASGSVTYTCTFDVSASNRLIMVYVFSYTGTCTFDQANRDGAASSPPVASGNITTTGTDEMCFGGLYSEGNQDMTALQINGTNVTAQVDNDRGTLSYLAFGSTFTGQFTANQAVTSRWNAGLIAFKNAGGGGGGGPSIIYTGCF